MSTAVAAPSPAAVLPPSVSHTSPRHFSSTAPTSRSPSNGEHPTRRLRTETSPAPPDRLPLADRSSSAGKPSPNSCVVHGSLKLRAAVIDEFSSDRIRTAQPPSIKVKREPGSPSLPSARPRPKRLDLSSSTAAIRGPQTARAGPLTSRDSAGLVAMHDVGLACLSPGFQTNDPSMREQLQRSLDVRDQQRLIIEARQKGTKPGSSRDAEATRSQDTTLFGVQTKTPTTSRRKGPPPGLSIHAPAASQFANDRVIQSAPMHQTFTGLRPGEHPMSRHIQHGPSALSQTSHIHHVPATQTNNRLPPLADVFAQDNLDAARGHPNRSPNHAHAPPPVPSPGFPPASHTQAPGSARAREFRSADEAMQSMSGGRDDLMPKVVHYGGVQPPTPPSPAPHRQYHSHQQPTVATSSHSLHMRHEPELIRPDGGHHSTSINGRRRNRDEYERDNGSPPSTFHRAETKRAALAERRDDTSVHHSEHDWIARMSGSEKKEEFLRLCERAWDLFHS